MSEWVGEHRYIATPDEPPPPPPVPLATPYDFRATQHPNGHVRCGNCSRLILECLDGSACFTCRKCHARNRIDTSESA